jgi:glycosyltransferase involved in cell wall biosynthesis
MYGATRSLIDLVLGLKDFGIESTVVTADRGPSHRVLEKNGIDVQTSWFEWSMGHRPNRLRDGVHRAAVNLVCLRRLRAIARNTRADAIYTNSSVVSVGSAVARLMKLPHIWHLREFGDLDYGLSHDFGQGFFLKSLSRAAAIITNSRAVRDHVCPRQLWHKTYVIHNGVLRHQQFDRLYELRKAARGSTTFLMCGTIVPAKGQLDAVRALAILRRRGFNVTLTVIGDGEPGFVKQCVDLAAQLNVANFVQMRGMVDDPFPFYTSAQALLVCSAHEAFGRVTVEAMAAGCVVIARASGGSIELIDDEKNGLLFRNSVEELAAKMELVLQQPDFAGKMSERAWVIARDKYSIERHSTAVASVLKGVISVRNAA